ncbi:MAG: hypothetical protein J4G10_00180 [Alphaproteobacteria bacterium]|nr:hypothetical protein [Alphaproteobacteria bacterium]
MLLRFEGVPSPVSFSGCEHLLPFLKPPVASWPNEAWTGDPTGPALAVTRSPTGYRIVAGNADSAESCEYADDYEVIASFFAELYMAFIAANPDLLCIHAAAMRWEGGLLVVPASGKAGKSTLTVHAAAAGATVFTDDVLAVREHEGNALSFGVAPRLRLPLPANVTEGFHAFLRDREILGNGCGQYVALRPGEIARFGEAAPIAAILLLDRVEAGPPALEAIGKSEVLRDLLGRNFTHSLDAETKLSRLLQLAKTGACYRLRYVDCESAIRLLREIA